MWCAVHASSRCPCSHPAFRHPPHGTLLPRPRSRPRCACANRTRLCTPCNLDSKAPHTRVCTHCCTRMGSPSTSSSQRASGGKDSPQRPEKIAECKGYSVNIFTTIQNIRRTNQVNVWVTQYRYKEYKGYRANILNTIKKKGCANHVKG